jgi:GNAT superfamily N-acetyltransferase
VLVQAAETLQPVTAVRQCGPDDTPAILRIINAASEKYRGVIPADCFHDPYMSRAELEREISNGVSFWGIDAADGTLSGVMGVQPVKDVTLVRHAYVSPEHQGKGIGGTLLRHVESLTDRRILIGTWADATWAIRFYQNHGYTLIPADETPALLAHYWTIGPRQVETSVVLSKHRPASNRSN